MSRRRKVGKRHQDGPLLDELLGRRAAHRARLGSAVLISLLVFGGSALFLFESQTLGSAALAVGLGWALFWLGVRQLARTGEAPEAAIRRRRGTLFVTGLFLVGAGWVVFFTLWEELGLLLVVVGAVPWLLITIWVKQDLLASPLDGPPFGETGPT